MIRIQNLYNPDHSYLEKLFVLFVIFTFLFTQFDSFARFARLAFSPTLKSASNIYLNVANNISNTAATPFIAPARANYRNQATPVNRSTLTSLKETGKLNFDLGDITAILSQAGSAIGSSSSSNSSGSSRSSSSSLCESLTFSC